MSEICTQIPKKLQNEEGIIQYNQAISDPVRMKPRKTILNMPKSGGTEEEYGDY